MSHALLATAIAGSDEVTRTVYALAAAENLATRFFNSGHSAFEPLDGRLINQRSHQRIALERGRRFSTWP